MKKLFILLLIATPVAVIAIVVSVANLAPEDSSASNNFQQISATVSIQNINQQNSTPAFTDYDVIIAGGGSSGIASSIQMKRGGLKVLIIEETDWLGGQMTAAGVSTMDEGLKELERENGLYAEFASRIKQYYQSIGKSVNTCYSGIETLCFEPNVGFRILVDMINSENQVSNGGRIDISFRTKIISVNKNGNTVTGVVTSKGSFNSKILIDATEYGDILPLAGIPYRVGNGTNTSPNANSCIQDITYTAIVKKYSSGVPSNLKITTKPPFYDEDAPSFRAVVASSEVTNKTGRYPVSFEEHNAYRGTPDSSIMGSYDLAVPGQRALISKTGLNWANDYPAKFTYTSTNPATEPRLTTRYLEDKDFRKTQNCRAKIETLNFIYYVQNELGFVDWSVANDEGYNTAYNIEENLCEEIPAEFKEIEKNFPVMPYVRESRRMIGQYTLTAKDISRNATLTYQSFAGQNATSYKSTNNFTDSVAIGTYPLDLHNCNNSSDLEAGLETIEDHPNDFRKGLFQIPLRTFIPQTVDGFLAAEKNISQSRYANGATRLQPSTFAIGQAVGELAVQSLKQNIQPRNIKAIDVQLKLLESNASIANYIFLDIPKTNSDWSSAQIASTYAYLVGYGNGNFGINDNLTREQMAVILIRLLKETPSAKTISSFTDVDSNGYAHPSIERLYELKVTGGCQASPLKFCPTSSLTKEQLAAFVIKVLKVDISQYPILPYYSDVASGYLFYPHIQKLAELGIMKECSDLNGVKNFCPSQNVTRSYVAEVIKEIVSYRGY